MDAHALLTSQGWRGTGNSLHPTSNNIGLSRPLLVSQKQNTLGIGKKQHRTSDMWWMNAFDSSLKGLDTSKEGQVTQTITSGGLDMVTKAGAKWVGSKGGLYASFVRGESLSGTLTPPVEGTDSEGSGDRKRKREGESKEEKRARKAAKREGKIVVEDKSKEIEGSKDKQETKEERRVRKAAKKARRDEETKAAESASTEDTPEHAVKSESKEERKERRRLKKLAKEKKGDIQTAEDKEPKKKKRRKDE